MDTVFVAMIHASDGGWLIGLFHDKDAAKQAANTRFDWTTLNWHDDGKSGLIALTLNDRITIKPTAIQ